MFRLASIRGSKLFWLPATLWITGCTTGSELRQLADVVAPTGAHSVEVKTRAGWTSARWISVLPGKDGPTCRAPPQAKGNVTVRNCTSTDTLQWLGVLGRAQQEMLHSFPQASPTSWRVDLVPAGQRHLHNRVARRRGTAIAMHMAFPVGEENLDGWQRTAVRSIAHEIFHIANAQRGLPRGFTNEYTASLASSCMEQRVFGSTRGYVWDFENQGYLPDFFNESQRRSVAGGMAARRRADAFFAGPATEDAQQRFGTFCAGLLDGTHLGE